MEREKIREEALIRLACAYAASVPVRGDNSASHANWVAKAAKATLKELEDHLGHKLGY